MSDVENTDGAAQREAQFAELLARYEEGLSGDTPRREVDSSVIADDIELDAELAAEWDGAKACLDMLDRVRRHWSPIADDETPAPWLTAELATPSPGGMAALGRFRIVRELGRGGLGVVYLAYDPQLGRHVALKVPRPEALASPDLRRRFLREAKAAARLSHPNLVTVHEAGEAGPICYIAAEFCPGPTLRDWLREQPGAADIGLAARLTMQLALGVQHAHGRGVLHRDIKPSNVMVGRLEAGEGRPEAGGWRPEDDNTSKSPHPDPLPPGEREVLCPKLTDFGMAKLLERAGDETHSGAIIGTPAYMAPEQAQGRVDELDARTDIYALGAILYELLTFRRAHGGRTELEALRGVLFEEPPAPRTLRREIPRDLEAIALKCLAKRPDDRYATAQQLADDLARFLAGEPTAARPLGPAAKLGKWARRRPALAVLLGVLAVSMLALFGTVVGYNARLSDEVARADGAREIAQREAEASRRLLYSGDVRLAHEALKVNNVVQALEILNRHGPRPGQEDLREFAWYYLRDQCQGESLILQGHDKPVMMVAFSPDGRLVASGGEDGTARIWDAATGDPLHVLRDGTIEVACVTFSPDGRLLATGNENGTIGLWDAALGTKHRTLAGHRGHVLSVAFSPDGKLLASGGLDSTARIWTLSTGDATVTLPVGTSAVRSLTFSPSGDRLYAVDETHRLHFWRTEGWERTTVDRLEGEKLFALAVSRDGSRVAAAGRRKEIAVWQSADGGLGLLDELTGGHTEWIESLAFSPLDDTLASGGKDRVIALWKPGLRQVARMILGHTGRVRSVHWSPDGRRLASAGADGVRIWSVADGATIDRYPPVPQARTRDAIFVADGSKLITTHWDNFIRVWDTARHTLLAEHRAATARLSDICISADDMFIAICTGEPTIKVFQRDPFHEVLSMPKGAGAIAWAPIGHHLATALDDTTVGIMDVETRRIERRYTHQHTVRNVAFTPDGRHLVTTGQALQIWNRYTGQLEFSQPGGCDRLVVSHDSRLIAASSGATVTLIDRSLGNAVTTLATIGLDDPELAIHGNTLALGFKQPTAVSLWDARTRQELLRLDCDGRNLDSITFSPDGRRLVATGEDTAGKGRIWEWTIRKER